ncbi:helix-turn-helix domain-containing protein [Novibacillus thermophilus]|uniref:HTH cro/C1-type domain-containing protein n=1 Tax=Novibacillus thermophilus TaxID=1471761 RepID=A0A1U9K5G0_9BACL|nr:helix-turn-helix transcriptional regulator [Novibacillus thermophilus]AQS55266.1 hypothetical protein B0W44_05210 [Novibacillus thermophilus]
MFGKRLSELRKKRGLSQYELADRLGFSRGQIANYEQGQREPDYNTLQKFADFFDTTTDYLLGRTDDPSPNNSSKVTVAGQEIELTPEQYKVFQEMMKHPKFAIMFHDLATDTEKKVKQLIDTWEFIRKQIEQDDDEEFGEGFGELED